MGRKRKDKADKQSECIMVRVTPAERERLAAEAEKLGISLSALLMKSWRKKEN